MAIAPGAVGRDPLTFTERYTFGTDVLTTGVSFVAIMIGTFGISEGLMQLHTVNTPAIKQKISKIVPSWSLVRKHLPLGIPGDAVTAIMIGALFIHGLNPGPMLMVEQPDMF
jgi:putative tricarboxylic transport membrane protein